ALRRAVALEPRAPRRGVLPGPRLAGPREGGVLALARPVHGARPAEGRARRRATVERPRPAPATAFGAPRGERAAVPVQAPDPPDGPGPDRLGGEPRGARGGRLCGRVEAPGAA